MITDHTITKNRAAAVLLHRYTHRYLSVVMPAAQRDEMGEKPISWFFCVREWVGCFAWADTALHPRGPQT